ncbi:HlyD family secretion protein [Pseudohalocynthiibacter aestuariivivens]|uniref:HlyD family secretion protein n=1 Tax=Pseudohalocynthiibacter aestuariivivens TaxID=1591409 RepID=A0ABV5JFD6_9RHOB|nr:biotin/lipoyl-binding protein [Pseudohalocynthiibacter aestuariivivens]MBS9718824.1 HlyD family secretion protein [Pseudohalocynthiibacter aestuariivivens]
MLEVLVCSLVTIFPDYLIRRYMQGKRIGQELTLFSVWYELRYGITTCALLTISLITLVFYYHPSTTNVSSFFRTVTILSEGSGRVEEVFIRNNQRVNAGDPLFSLDAARQRAAVETAKRRVQEVEAAFAFTEAEVKAAEGAVENARGVTADAQEELEVRQALLDRGSTAVSTRDVEKLQNAVVSSQGALAAALAKKEAVEAQLSELLPAQLATTEAALEQAMTDLEKMVVYAGVDGDVEQFTLQPGDIVSPVLRPAGILVPSDMGRGGFQAGFSQLSAQVIKPGMIGEITCMSLPFTIVPMKVVTVSNYISAGQFRPSDQLLDIQDRARPGTITVYMEPLFEGSTDKIFRGSKCIANIYTNNHDRLAHEDLGSLEWTFLHVVDTVGVVHASLLRIQALMLPVQNLVLTGH